MTSRKNRQTRNQKQKQKQKQRQRKSRKMRGGNQYLNNVGYATGYTLPFYKPYVYNIVNSVDH